MIELPKALRHWLQHEGTLALIKPARESRDAVWMELLAACRESTDPRVVRLVTMFDGYQGVVNLVTTGGEHGNTKRNG